MRVWGLLPGIEREQTLSILLDDGALWNAVLRHLVGHG